MLGITVPDAIAIGALVAAVLAGILGKKSGEAAAKVKPPDPVASSIAAVFADKDLMTRQTLAMEDLARTVKEFCRVQTDKHEAAVEASLKEIKHLLDNRP